VKRRPHDESGRTPNWYVVEGRTPETAKKLVYYESIKRELKKRLIYEYRCDERLKN